MKIEYALEKMKERFENRFNIRIKKAADYAGDKDCLQNFKKVALLLKTLDVDPTTSYGVAMIYTVLKIDRLCNLVFRKKVKDPQNESISDTIDDLINYEELLRECLEDEFLNKGE